MAGSSSAAEVVGAINASKNAVENNAMAQWNAGDIMGLHPDTAKAYASIASADNMTNEEKLQSFEELTKGINMYDPAREYIEQWVKTPQYVALMMGGAYAEAAALVGMIESAVKNNGAPSIDDVGMIQLYNKLQVGSFISNVTNAGKGTNTNKLPNGYSEFESTLSAASNNKGGLPEGYRRVINNTTGETKILGSDGKIYNEIKLSDGSSKLQNLNYESAPYHGTTNNAVKNKAPAYGQDALDMSIQIKDTSTRRIGIDYKTNEIVVFDNTINNTYHGHVRSWQELTQEMKNTLIKNGVTDNKGRVITR